MTDKKTQNLVLDALYSIRDEVRSLRGDTQTFGEELRSLRGEVTTLHSRVREVGAQQAAMSDQLDAVVEEQGRTNERLDRVERRQVEGEIRLAAELVAVSGTLREMNARFGHAMQVRRLVDEHERRLLALEARESKP